MSVHPALRAGPTSERKDQPVMRADAGMKPGQLVACSISLIVAGLLLTRGFIGFNPGRPLFVVLGVALAASATIGLAVDHVRVRPTRESPSDAFASELTRSRRYGHPLGLMAIDCDDETGERIVRLMRGSDCAWQHHGLRILLPETDGNGMIGFAERLEAEVGVSGIRAAVFPLDALTMDGLERALTPVVTGLGPSASRPSVGPVLVPDPEADPPDQAMGER